MTNGAFDDRDNARRHVKLWMRDAAPGDYTVGNLMGLARQMVVSDSEPVDDIRVQWTETSYGLVRGVVEFAADQLSAERIDTVRDGSDSCLVEAAAFAWQAAGALPYRTTIARRHLLDALELLNSSFSVDHSPTNIHRAQRAMSLALMMLGTPPGRSVAA